MNRAVVGLGSNIDPGKNIKEARRLLSSQFKVVKFSKFIKTPPKGNSHQPEFINGGALIETHLSQNELKRVLKDFETKMGRTNDMHCNKPRVIDFDIHVWNDQIIDPYFYRWDFLKEIVLDVLPDIRYDSGEKV